MSDRSDAELLAAHVAGDPAAFGELFQRHRERLWAVAVRTTGKVEDAADALQDAMLKAHRAAPQFRAEAKVTTWLHRIVVNACIDRGRRKKVGEPLPLEYDVVDDRPTPEAEALSEDVRRAVVAALSLLSGDMRAALVLVDMEGYSVAEAAAILDCPEGTVKSRCSRARTRMVKLLRQAGVEPGTAFAPPASDETEEVDHATP